MPFSGNHLPWNKKQIFVELSSQIDGHNFLSHDFLSLCWQLPMSAVSCHITVMGAFYPTLLCDMFFRQVFLFVDLCFL